MRAMADATARLGEVGAQSAARLDARLADAGEPAGRIRLLDTALEELDRLEATLAGLDLGRPAGLLPPLRRAHTDLTEAVERARTKLGEGRELIVPVRDLLQGPSTLLLLAANNAEMAGGSGLALSAGGLTIEGGEISLGEVVQAGDLRLPESVELPGDLRRIYEATGVGLDLRSTTRTPDLAAMGPVVVEQMARHGVAIEGVIVVDAVALRDLMAVTGPVEVDDERIDAETVLAEVLHTNYLQFGTTAVREERVSYQGDIAKAVFDSLTTRQVSSVDLADALLGTSEGRHLMLWSADPALQAVWSELGLAGGLDPRGLMVSFQNYGADKLDWFLRPEASLDVGVLPSGDFRARLTMRVRVPTEAEMDGTSPYILGPTPEAHGIFLTVHLPEAAYDIGTPHARGFRSEGVESRMQVRTFLADVPLGSTFERTVEFSLPRAEPLLTLLPSARLEPLTLLVDGRWRIRDAVPTPFSWAAAVPDGPADEPISPWVRVPLTVAMTASVGATGVTAWWSRRLRPRAAPLPGTAGHLAVTSLTAFAVAAAAAMVLVWSGPRR